MSKRNSHEQKKARRAERELMRDSHPESEASDFISILDRFPIDTKVDDDMDTFVCLFYGGIEVKYGMRGEAISTFNGEPTGIQFMNRYVLPGEGDREVVGTYAPGLTPQCLIIDVVDGVPQDDLKGMSAEDMHSYLESIIAERTIERVQV